MREIQYFDFDLDKTPEENWDPIFGAFNLDRYRQCLNQIISPYKLPLAGVKLL